MTLVLALSCKKKEQIAPLPPLPIITASYSESSTVHGEVTLTIQVKNSDRVNIYWGDGYFSPDQEIPPSNELTETYTYLNNGSFKVTIGAWNFPNPDSASYTLSVTISDINGEQVRDRDGNVYHTVTIGTQVWMVENLKTTRLNDGTEIPWVTDNAAWGILTTPGYDWYNNDEATYKNTYGALYNWFTVNTGKLAPTGWHVPTDAEWTILTTYLGGETIAGGKMKSTGTIEAGTGLWYSPNTGATNSSGFTALPGGIRLSNGGFGNLTLTAPFWSSTEYSYTLAWFLGLLYIDETVYRSSGNYKTCGLSVRCVQD